MQKPPKSRTAVVLDALHRIYSVRNAADFPATLISAAAQIVPCVNISFDSVNLATGIATDVFDRPIPIPHDEFLKRWQVYCHQHPGIAFLERGGRATVFALTDFTTQRRLRETAFLMKLLVQSVQSTRLG